MADLNIFGVGKRYSYIKADRVRERLPFQTVILMASAVLCSFQYVRHLSELVYKSSGVTVLIFRFVYGIVIVYPWVTACLFIGQYTKKYFLVTRHMAPLFKGPMVIHFILSPLYFAKSDEFPSVLKAINSIINWNSTLFEECEKAIMSNLLEERSRCGMSNPINYTSLCFIRKQKLFVPTNDVLSDIVHPATGIIVSFLAVFRGLKLFKKVFYCILSLCFGINLLGLLFTFMRYRLSDTATLFVSSSPTNGVLASMSLLVRGVGWEIQSLTINSPVLIMLGVHLPIHKTPAVSALIIVVYQYVLLILSVFTYVSNLSVVASWYNVSVLCIKTEFFESFLSSLFATTNILYEDQGLTTVKAMHILNFLVLRGLQLIFISVHMMGLYYTLIEELPLSLTKHKRVHQLVLLFYSFVINSFSHILLAKSSITVLYIRPLIVKVGLFNSMTFTLAVLFIYGTFELNKDMMFLFSKGMIDSTRTLMTILPFIVCAYFLWRMYFFFIIQPLSITITEMNDEIEPIVYYLVIIIPMFIMTAWTCVSVIIEYFRGNISEAFLPERQWFPWSPPNEDYGEERENFQPETAVKFEGDYYRCSHNCWLDNEVIADEIEESEITSKKFTAEIKRVNIKALVPKLYEEYEHVLQFFENKKGSM